MITRKGCVVMEAETGHIYHSGTSTRKAKKLERMLRHATERRAEELEYAKYDYKLGRAMRNNPHPSTTGLVHYDPLEVPEVILPAGLVEAFKKLIK